jgi:arylsulfate sulfotransferase
MERSVLQILCIICAVVLTTCARADKKTIPIAISPQSAIVNAGHVEHFDANTSDHSRVVWSVNGLTGGSSMSGTIDSDGNYTAPMVTVNTTVVVSIVTKRDPSSSASALVSIVALPGNFTVSPQSAVVGSGQVKQFTTNFTRDTSAVVWSVNGIAAGNSTIGTIDAAGYFMAPAVTQNVTATITATSKTDSSNSASANVTIIAPGVVAHTANVQVATYTITPVAGSNISIQFGLDTNYGLRTWQQPAPSGGGAVRTLVAGMRLNSTYHMRATLTLADGSEFDDVDHTFLTGDIPATNLPSITASTTPGLTPQSGVELLDLLNGINQRSIVVTDLAGNVIWTYDPGSTVGAITNPIKLLPNGHFLINFTSGGDDGSESLLQEIDLAGQVVWQLAAADLNNALAAAKCAGCNITVIGSHHDFIALPNGHLILIASQAKSVSGVVGFPDPSRVVGDVIIDLDENHKPVWLWSAFDHLDVNRHPMAFPDWTHSNAVVYSPDDKSLILTVRHQHWVIKIDYNDGQGTGNILWKLGYQGDFSLQNGIDPQDWFYAQHDANVISPNSSGTLQLLLFDNGNQRVLDSIGTICGVTGTPPCVSHVPILQLDETTKTATMEWLDDLSPIFSTFGGSARLLDNGNVEFAECGPINPGSFPSIREVTRTAPPQSVWQLQTPGQNIYRGFRIPSLYPGVQW